MTVRSLITTSEKSSASIVVRITIVRITFMKQGVSILPCLALDGHCSKNHLHVVVVHGYKLMKDLGYGSEYLYNPTYLHVLIILNLFDVFRNSDDGLLWPGRVGET